VIIVAVILSLFMAAPAGTQGRGHGTIQGVVVSRDNRQPLAGANVVLLGTVLGTTTDENGRFVLTSVPAGVYAVAVSLVGYERTVARDLRVGDDGTVSLTIELQPVPIQTEPVVVTASKYEQSLQEVPISLSVIDGKELSYRNAITIDDALRYVAGVNVTQGQINIRGSTGYSRGVGTRVLLLLDGLPLLSGDTGEIIWESLPVYQIQRVEIVKGAGSALYGSSALGGVVNVITRDVRDLPETRLRVYGGMYEKPKYPQWRWTNSARMFNGVSINHAQRFDDLRLFAGLSRTADEGFKQNDFWRRYNASIRVGYDFSPFESLTLLFSYLNQRRGNFLYWKSLDSALTPPDAQLQQRVESNRWSLGAQWTQFLSHNWYYAVRTGLYRTRWEDNIANRLDSSGNKSIAHVLNGEIQMVYSGFDRHVVTYGIYGSYNNVSADTIFGKRSGYNIALYAQDEWRPDEPVQFVFGARYDMQHLEGTRRDGQLNPKLAVVYTLDDVTTLRVSAGRGFRAPSIAEVYTTTEAGGVPVQPNPALRSERSWSYEFGGSRVLADNVFMQAALFQNDFWDLIEPTFGTDGIVRFQNVTRARVQGGEVSISTSWFERLLQTDLGYTYMYPRDVSRNDILRYRPRHLLYATVRISYGDARLGLDYRYLSKVERIDEEFVVFGIITQGDKRVPISVADARLSYDWKTFGIPCTTTFHVNNLFGYYYVELIGNMAPIRNYVLTLEAAL